MTPLDRLADSVRAYRARQDRIVTALSRIAAALDASDVPAAQREMADLLAGDLKQSRDRTRRHCDALQIAVAALTSRGSVATRADAAAQIRRLAPEAFEPAGAAQ